MTLAPLRWSWLALAALVVGCAQPSLKHIEIDPAVAAREAELQRQMFARAYIRDWMRLSRVAHRVGAGAVAFCGESVGWSIGIFPLNSPMLDGEFKRPITTVFDLGTALTVLDVTPGSPAAAAGVAAGDELVSIAGVAIPESARASKRVASLIASNGPQKSGMPLVVRRDGREVALVVHPVKVCRFPYHVVSNPSVNAYADGEHMVFYTGLLDFAETDDELAQVYAHELSHNLLDHIDKQQQNQLAGAALGLVLDVLAAAAGVNTGGDFMRIGAQQGALAYSADFEAEADYLAVYMLARSGYDGRAGADFWRRLSSRNYESIDYSRTHPSHTYRAAALLEAANEVDRKQLAGLPLIPDLAEGVDEAPIMVAAQPPPAPSAALALAPAPTAAGKLWRGEGSADACGQPFSIVVAVAGDSATGTLLRGGVSYDVQGTLDGNRMTGATAGKSLASLSRAGPRRLRLEATFADDGGEAGYWIERGGERECETRLQLRRD